MKVEGLVEGWLQGAIEAQAADVHIEPFEDAVRVRQRVDQGLRLVANVPVHLSKLILAHIKVLAHLDIAQTQEPQDGRIAWRTQPGQVLDIRVAITPSLYGEAAVMRLLNKRERTLDLHGLGLPASICSQLLACIHACEGLLLVTGPTGSGKTTTLYALLQTLATQTPQGLGSSKKILTLEDPIEYTYDHLFQVAVKPRIGLTFASGLRAFLRHDPDVIMVGELRDAATAQLAAQAALTGHLVLSTLHTRDAASTPARLIQMGVPAYQVRTLLLGVLAQRLVPSPSGSGRSACFSWLSGSELFEQEV